MSTKTVTNDTPLVSVSFSHADNHDGSDDALSNANCALMSDPYRQENLELKLQMVRQKQEIDLLSSRLRQCKVENEALHAENAVLVDKLVFSAQEPPNPELRWSSKGRARSDSGGSMQLLIDKNAKLMTDNNRLQVTAGVVHKSFQNFIKDSQRSKDEDRQTMQALQQENEQLKECLSVSEKLKLSSSNDQAEETSWQSSADQELCTLDFSCCRPRNISESDFTANTTLGSSQESQEDLPSSQSSLTDLRSNKTSHTPHLTDQEPCTLDFSGCRPRNISESDFTAKTTLGSSQESQEDLPVDDFHRSNRDYIHLLLNSTSAHLTHEQRRNRTIGVEKTDKGLVMNKRPSVRGSRAVVATSQSLTHGKPDIKTTARRLCHSLTERMARRESDELLVTFNETRRSRCAAGRTHSL